MQKRQLGSCVTFFPQPTTLITSVDDQGLVNVMTASWAGIVSKTPPTLAISLNKGRLSYQNIKETGCFTVNTVPASLATEADFCGIRSGRDTDKLAKAGFDLTPAVHQRAPLIEQCPLNVECRLVREIEIGEYGLLLGEILDIHAIESAFDDQDQASATPFEPLVYLGGVREYWSLGTKIADAYKDGLRLSGKDEA